MRFFRLSLRTDINNNDDAAVVSIFNRDVNMAIHCELYSSGGQPKSNKPNDTNVSDNVVDRGFNRLTSWLQRLFFLKVEQLEEVYPRLPSLPKTWYH